MIEAPARSKLDEFGIDAICAEIGNTRPYTAIAAKVGVSVGSLAAWLEADAERSARARDARRRTARMWDDKAEEVLRDEGLDFQRARELAHHYRWRAAKIAPAEFGDKTQHTGADGVGPVVTEVRYRWDEPPKDKPE